MGVVAFVRSTENGCLYDDLSISHYTFGHAKERLRFSAKGLIPARKQQANASIRSRPQKMAHLKTS